MNLHRVSTHISPIASEVAAQRTVFFWPLEIASSPRAPEVLVCVGSTLASPQQDR
jgi:hypothetical protein